MAVHRLSPDVCMLRSNTSLSGSRVTLAEIHSHNPVKTEKHKLHWINKRRRGKRSRDWAQWESQWGCRWFFLISCPSLATREAGWVTNSMSLHPTSQNPVSCIHWNMWRVEMILLSLSFKSVHTTASRWRYIGWLWSRICLWAFINIPLSQIDVFFYRQLIFFGWLIHLIRASHPDLMT